MTAPPKASTAKDYYRSMFALPERDGWFSVPCPFESETKRKKLRVDTATGAFHCYSCEAKGGGILKFHALLRHKGDCKQAKKDLGSKGFTIERIETTAAAKPVVIDQHKLAAVHKVWSEAKPITPDDPGGKYLRATRGFDLSAEQLTSLSPALRFTWTAPYGVNHVYPAVLAAFHSPAGELIQVLRIYLERSGAKKKNLVEGNGGKMLMPSPGFPMDGGAIRLYEPTEILGIAEGCETAIGAHLLTGVPVWSVHSCEHMPNVVVPESVPHIVIFADNDSVNPKTGRQPGREAALKLSARLRKENPVRKVEILLPSTVKDFADLVKGDTA